MVDGISVCARRSSIISAIIACIHPGIAAGTAVDRIIAGFRMMMMIIIVIRARLQVSVIFIRTAGDEIIPARLAIFIGRKGARSRSRRAYAGSRR